MAQIVFNMPMVSPAPMVLNPLAVQDTFTSLLTAFSGSPTIWPTVTLGDGRLRAINPATVLMIVADPNESEVA